MNSPKQHQQTAYRSHLWRLFFLRIIAMSGYTVAFMVATFHYHVPLPYLSALGLVGILTLFNAWTWLVARSPRPITTTLLLIQLLVDITVLTGLLYLSGGAANPFTSLYLLPLTISATILPARYTWILAAITIGCYSLLIPYHVPLMMLHQHDANIVDLHIMGMWLGFIISAGLVAYFIVGMGNTLRQHQQALARAREKALRDERLLALGTQAAAVAHELGTPLGTISLLISELSDPELTANEREKQLATLRQQVNRCKASLESLAASVGNHPASAGHPQAVHLFLQEWLEEWQRHNPDCQLTIDIPAADDSPILLADRTLHQALDNVLDNAARVSPKDIEVWAEWDLAMLNVEIRDRGPGLKDVSRQQLGRAPVTDDAQGMGLGLFLTQAIIERFSGKFTLFERRDRGVIARITIPLMRYYSSHE